MPSVWRVYKGLHREAISCQLEAFSQEIHLIWIRTHLTLQLLNLDVERHLQRGGGGLVQLGGVGLGLSWTSTRGGFVYFKC
ncbi:hypothetical protein FKM82_019975 [Ascaphus truei]